MSDTPETDEARKERMRGGWEGVPVGFAQELERQRNEAVEIARTAIGAIETIYGHSQFCDQCQSFEIAKQCRDELHGFERLNSLQNGQDDKSA